MLQRRQRLAHGFRSDLDEDHSQELDARDSGKRSASIARRSRLASASVCSSVRSRSISRIWVRECPWRRRWRLARRCGRTRRYPNSRWSGSRGINAEHLAILRQGAAIWNEWRQRNPNIRPDLTEADLNEANLYEAKLNDADLNGADLRQASLSAADLSAANLSSAKLSNADLTMANLSWAVLTGAVLTGADLGWTVLTDAELDGADLNNVALYETNFGNVRLDKTLGLDNCDHQGRSILDFCTLSRSGDLPLSFLRGCGLPDRLIDYLPYLRASAIEYCSCFISYSEKNGMFAGRLRADLKDKGVQCWFAPHDLPIGAKPWDAIDKAIRHRDKVLVVLSKSSLDSDWVEDEVTKAYAEERSRKEVVLFPISIDNAVKSTDKPWAVKLRERNIGDFRQWKKPEAYQKGLDKLLRDLKASGTK